jgi:hypothetical protein
MRSCRKAYARGRVAEVQTEHALTQACCKVESCKADLATLARVRAHSQCGTFRCFGRDVLASRSQMPMEGAAGCREHFHVRSIMCSFTAIGEDACSDHSVFKCSGVRCQTLLRFVLRLVRFVCAARRSNKRFASQVNTSLC